MLFHQSSRPVLLDLFCCQGGAAMGYHRAGFDIVGVDIKPQPKYPFEFHRMDALRVLTGELDWPEGGGMVDPDAYSAWSEEWEQLRLDRFDAIHASPPCQGYLNLTRVNEKLGRNPQHADLIWATRKALRATGLPYVIENVQDARNRLIEPVRLCGTSFGLPLRRHRLFESNVELAALPCAHHLFTEKKYWTGWRPKGQVVKSTVVQVYGNAADKHEWPAAMGIDWMTNDGMAEAVPPAYTEHIGQYLMRAVDERATRDVAGEIAALSGGTVEDRGGHWTITPDEEAA